MSSRSRSPVACQNGLLDLIRAEQLRAARLCGWSFIAVPRTLQNRAGSSESTVKPANPPGKGGRSRTSKTG